MVCRRNDEASKICQIRVECMATVSIEIDGCTSRRTNHGDHWCTFSRTQDEHGFGQTETAEDVNPPQSVSPQAHAPQCDHEGTHARPRGQVLGPLNSVQSKFCISIELTGLCLDIACEKMSEIIKAHISCEVMSKHARHTASRNSVPMSDHGAKLRQQRESIISCHSATTDCALACVAEGQPSTSETATAPSSGQEYGLSPYNFVASCRALLRRSSTLVQASRSCTEN